MINEAKNKARFKAYQQLQVRFPKLMPLLNHIDKLSKAMKPDSDEAKAIYEKLGDKRSEKMMTKPRKGRKAEEVWRTYAIFRVNAGFYEDVEKNIGWDRKSASNALAELARIGVLKKLDLFGKGTERLAVYADGYWQEVQQPNKTIFRKLHFVKEAGDQILLKYDPYKTSSAKMA